MTDAELKIKQGLREKAAKDLETWYEQRKQAIEKQKVNNRLAETPEPEEKPSTSTDASSSRWEKVADLIDFQMTSEKDTSRMKSILLGLKNAPTAAS